MSEQQPSLSCVSVLVSLKIQPLGVWHETGVFRKRFLFSQVCHQLHRSVKVQDDKDITKPKKKLLVAVMHYEKFLSLSTSTAGLCTRSSLLLLP